MHLVQKILSLCLKIIRSCKLGILLSLGIIFSLEFFIDVKSFRSHYGPRVDSASNRNEYQEHFQGVKAAGA